MKKFNYDSLKKIKRPVMLVVEYSGRFDEKYYRVRILFPDGTCIYNRKDCLESKYEHELDYHYSCFLMRDSKGNLTAYQDLERTVLCMKNYDSRHEIKVKKVIKL